MINLNSLWGKNEYKNTNNTAGIKNFLILESKNTPIGTSKTDVAIPLGIAE